MFGAGNQGRSGGRRARLRRAAALALVGAVLTGAAACGGDGATDGGKGGKDARTDGKAPASTPADGAEDAAESAESAASAGSGELGTSGGSGALSQRDLTALAFTDGEKIGKYTAGEFSLGEPQGEDYTADPAACQPLVSLAKGATAFDPASEVHRNVDVAEEMVGATVAVQLRSYNGGGAVGVMKALGAAGKACAGGFVENRAVAKGQYLKVEPVKAPDHGDEAQAYRFTILDVKGTLKLYEYLTVVRSGATTLSFRADILDTKDIGKVPEEVITAQWKKFEAASTR
ncbi:MULTISPECIES: hypothetical protein [Streptomyces]|uniref:hypothetical protein n=1 Tax=Streptomyces TaxID=1883 RepID=UPI00084C47B1|nr:MULTISPECIES: hypothetical protein [Streptomyces]TFI24345.1 hypothetical protein E4P36_24020 [Streptomyces sp. 4R-3d]